MVQFFVKITREKNGVAFAGFSKCLSSNLQSNRNSVCRWWIFLYQRYLHSWTKKIYSFFQYRPHVMKKFGKIIHPTRVLENSIKNNSQVYQNENTILKKWKKLFRIFFNYPSGQEPFSKLSPLGRARAHNILFCQNRSNHSEPKYHC